ncbi:MAG: lysophospholipid acyltransferase family protein [Planctomycetes bacterium]|nr:lysophospholipid acyltransferase family protein [Planctomycetota bacterium]MCB9920510.1 lysophospholipid acyltransferase family protein [Planctomycetota bacterium]
MADEARNDGKHYKRSRSRWKRFRRRVVAVALTSVCRATSLLPFAFTRRVLPFLTRIAAHRAIRGKVHGHLTLAFGDELSSGDKTRISKTIAHNLGLVVAEVLAASRGKLPPGYIDENDAADRAKSLFADGGFIGLTGHIGNWELLGAQLAKHFPGRADSVIAKRLGNPGLNEFVEDLRTRLGMSTFYQNESPMRLVRGLRQHKIIGTVPDQDVARLAGEFVTFFGKPAYTPTGPAALALHGRVPILPAFLRRHENGLRLIVCEPIWPDFAADRDAEVLRLTQAWSAAVEAAIREQPSDWMWFHERWQTTPERLEARRKKRERAG